MNSKLISRKGFGGFKWNRNQFCRCAVWRVISRCSRRLAACLLLLLLLLMLLLLLLLLLMLERPQWLPSPPSIVPSPVACSENEVSIRCMRGGCDASA